MGEFAECNIFLFLNVSRLSLAHLVNILFVMSFIRKKKKSFSTFSLLVLVLVLWVI